MQFDLFPPPPLDTAADAALAAKRPAGLFLGTSSWTFRGWGGLVYRGTVPIPDGDPDPPPTAAAVTDPIPDLTPAGDPTAAAAQPSA